MEKILVDTGPLVAVLDRSDRHHARCVEALREIRAPLLTVWPVLMEAGHLMSFSSEAQDELLALALDGTLRVEPLTDADLRRMRELVKKYRDLPMDLADAALVSVAERVHVRTIFTTDQRDFSVYRTKGRQRFTLLPKP